VKLRRRGRTAALVAVLTAALLGAGAGAPAHAADLPASEVRALAAAAREDAAARTRLAGVDAVDGRPVDLGAILAGARPDEIAARVELALASAQAGGGQDAAGTGDRARERARDVLRDRRYTGTDVPRPFAGVLRWLSRRLAPVGRAISDLVARIPGPDGVGWLVLAVLVVVVAAILARVTIRHRIGGVGGAGRDPRAARPDDPAALERAAEAAERAGDWEAAVRLRFRAGLLRLDARHVIAYRASLTTGEVARALRSQDFDRLGRDFDAIAYGGRPAAAADAEHAREGWRAVLAGAPAP
jgi:hypothetical protein